MNDKKIYAIEALEILLEEIKNDSTTVDDFDIAGSSVYEVDDFGENVFRRTGERSVSFEIHFRDDQDSK